MASHSENIQTLEDRIKELDERLSVCETGHSPSLEEKLRLSEEKVKILENKVRLLERELGRAK